MEENSIVGITLVKGRRLVTPGDHCSIKMFVILCREAWWLLPGIPYTC